MSTPTPNAAAPQLVQLLKEAAELFRFYEESHRAKGPGHETKVARNADIAARIETALAQQVPEPQAKQWPFAESPGEFTSRLQAAWAEFGSLLPAVRHVLIENPPTMAAQQVPAVTGWQPIETAPTDGTMVLLAGCRKQVVAAWVEHEIEWWHVDDNKHGPFPLRGPAPTHWMPLPAAPLPTPEKPA